MRRNLLVIAGLILWLVGLATAGLDAQQRGQRGSRAPEQPAQATSPAVTPPRAAAPPEEKSSVTHHSARVGGQPINYTATAATYVIKSQDGVPKATFFFGAYTKDGVPDVSKRPVSFVYNGGPGSASCWTHMGWGRGASS